MHFPSDDVELMSRIAARDQQAMGTLYDQYGKAVYSLAYRILQNATFAEEITQDTFFKVWEQTTRWDPERGKLSSWLLKITQFGAIDRLRHERRQPMLHSEPIEETDEIRLIDKSPSLWQDGTILRQLITKLPPEQAFLIELAFFHGMSHGEIADSTKLPLGTVKTRLRTGLRHLRELWLESSNGASKQP